MENRPFRFPAAVRRKAEGLACEPRAGRPVRCVDRVPQLHPGRVALQVAVEPCVLLRVEPRFGADAITNEATPQTDKACSACPSWI